MLRMTATVPFPHLVSPVEDTDERMSDYQGDDRRSGQADRRTHADTNGRSAPWPAIFAALVSIMLALLSVAVIQLSDIKRSVQETRDMAIIQRATQETMRRDIDKIENRVDTIEKAYQYNLNSRLSYIEAKTGIKKPSQDKEGD